MIWIASAGGPLVLIPKSKAHLWHGSVCRCDGGSDYEIACTINDYAGSVKTHGMDVLVLDDEPYQTTAWADPDGTMLVRWIYAPSEDAVVQYLRTVRHRLIAPEEKMAFLISEKDQILMDAAESGNRPGSSLSVQIDPAEYRVATYLDKPTEELALVIHAFERIE